MTAALLVAAVALIALADPLRSRRSAAALLFGLLFIAAGVLLSAVYVGVVA